MQTPGDSELTSPSVGVGAIQREVAVGLLPLWKGSELQPFLPVPATVLGSQQPSVLLSKESLLSPQESCILKECFSHRHLWLLFVLFVISRPSLPEASFLIAA